MLIDVPKMLDKFSCQNSSPVQHYYRYMETEDFYAMLETANSLFRTFFPLYLLILAHQFEGEGNTSSLHLSLLYARRAQYTLI